MYINDPMYSVNVSECLKLKPHYPAEYCTAEYCIALLYQIITENEIQPCVQSRIMMNCITINNKDKYIIYYPYQLPSDMLRHKREKGEAISFLKNINPYVIMKLNILIIMALYGT